MYIRPNEQFVSFSTNTSSVTYNIIYFHIHLYENKPFWSYNLRRQLEMKHECFKC
jgi:hypothetical protein